MSMKIFATILIWIVIALGWIFILTYLCSADEIDDLIFPIVQVESNGNPNAISKAGCVGLLQISPIVLKEWNDEIAWCYKMWGFDYADGHTGALEASGFTENDSSYEWEDLLYPEVNLRVGEWYLRRLRDHYLKDVEFSIYAYDEKTKKQYLLLWKDKQHHEKYEPEIRFYWEQFFKTHPSDIEAKLCLVLVAYNGGITRLKSVGYDINKMPDETKQYVRRVLTLYKESQCKK